MSKNNVVLLPNTIAEMELDIESLMQKKDFEAALDKLELLLSHQHHTFLVYRNTLVCLTKLHHTNDAIDMCEDLLMDEQSEYYYDYLEFYIILLYETEAYTDLIILFEAEKDHMPQDYAERMKKFNVLASQMRTWQQEEKLKELLDAIQKKDVRAQHRLIMQWKKKQLSLPDLFSEMLSESDIHPVIKTELFICLQAAGKQDEVVVNKVGKTLSLSPTFMLPLTRHPSYVESIATIEDIEQQDPILYMLTKEIIDNYAFVLYPVLYDQLEAGDVAKRALAIAKANLGIEETMVNDKITQSILMNQERYQEIML